jgi:hypothetical protein
VFFKDLEDDVLEVLEFDFILENEGEAGNAEKFLRVKGFN